MIDVLVEPAPTVAVIVAATAIATGDVDVLNDPEDSPAVIFTVEGAEAAPVELARETAIPPAGAGPDRLTVQVLGLLPVTVPGAQLIEVSTGA